MRRYEVDSIRSIALLLLIFYHIVISFFPETKALIFIVNPDKADLGVGLLIVVSQALNIWRIPILFFIAGMAINFSSQRRNITEILKERSLRILVPLFFCSIFITPTYFYIHANYYNYDYSYWPAPAYLWFLNAIFYYSLLTLPIISIQKTNPKIFGFFHNLLNNKFRMFFIFSIPMVIIATLGNPETYPNFVNFAAFPLLDVSINTNIHGFLVGLICFLIGFLFASSGEIFWNSVRSIKFITLAFAIVLFMQRLFLYLLPVWDGNPGAYPLVLSNVLTAFESVCWMLSLVGFASSFLNKKNPILDYITPAVFPVYIFHLPVQNFLASLIYPLSIAPIVKLIILTFSTILVSVFLYEVVRRLKWFRVVFGMRP